MSASDRTKSINLELLEEMFQIEEKEKAINPGQFTPHPLFLKMRIRFKLFLESCCCSLFA